MTKAKKAAAVVVFGLLGVFLLIAVMLPSLCRSSETANRVKCASNLRQIGHAIQLYAADNKRAFPDNLSKLLLTQDITPEVFTCPSSNDTKAAGETLQEAAANLYNKGHLSYIYVGAGLTADLPGDAAVAVVAYEPPINHDELGGNVLFADGHVEWIDQRQLPSLLSKRSTHPASSSPINPSPERSF